MSEVKEKYEHYLTNPFSEDVVIIPRSVKVTGVDENRILKDTRSGEESHVKFSYNVVKDDESFVKIYKENIKKMFDLSSCAYKVFWFVCVHLRPNNDIVHVDRNEFMHWCDYKNRKSYYDGINELLDKGVLAMSDKEQYFFINHSVFFNGNRMKIETVFYKT
jgi:hypothetical protein